MPNPLFGENGSGMHTHMSLFKDGRNQFFAQDEPYHLSAAGKAFIAGQLCHAREIAAVFAQWVNSYKRLVPGYEAPVYVAWSQRNRSALIRIPLYKPGSEQATRAEIRCPDPACNPYLTFAALLHAGLEGIEKGYELPDPMETNLYHLTAEQRRERGIVSLPETLGEATDALDVRLGLGDELGGLVLLSIAGSLPELAITISAAAQGNLGLAAGNLIGGIAIQTMVLLICDIAAGPSRPLTYLVGALTPVLEGLLVIIVVAGVEMGALLKPTVAIAGRIS